MTVIFEVKYESFWFDIGPVVQTGRIRAWHAWGQGFKSLSVHHLIKKFKNFLTVIFF